MAEEKMTTTVKVLKDFHQFSGMDKDGNVEVPTHLVTTYASLGVISMPAGFDKSETKKAVK